MHRDANRHACGHSQRHESRVPKTSRVFATALHDKHRAYMRCLVRRGLKPVHIDVHIKPARKRRHPHTAPTPHHYAACPRGTKRPCFFILCENERLRLKAPSTAAPLSTASRIARARSARSGR